MAQVWREHSRQICRLRSFKETLALHIGVAQDKGASFLFESSWKKPYSTRGVRAMLARYAAHAGLEHNMAPHRLRHFLFTWLKTQGIDDALIQPYSGHHNRTNLEIYSKISSPPRRTPTNRSSTGSPCNHLTSSNPAVCTSWQQPYRQAHTGVSTS